MRSLLMVVTGTYITRDNSEFKNNKMERKKIYDSKKENICKIFLVSLSRR